MNWKESNKYEHAYRVGSVAAWIKAHVVYPGCKAQVAHWRWWALRKGASIGEGTAPDLDAAKAAAERAAGPYLRLESVLPHMSLSAEMARLVPGCSPKLGVLAVKEEEESMRVLAVMDLDELPKDLLVVLGYGSLDELLKAGADRG